MENILTTEEVTKIKELQATAPKPLPFNPKEPTKADVFIVDKNLLTLQLSKRGPARCALLFEGKPIHGCITGLNVKMDLETNLYELNLTMLGVKVEVVD